jgi:hypothetical protein
MIVRKAYLARERGRIRGALFSATAGAGETAAINPVPGNLDRVPIHRPPTPLTNTPAPTDVLHTFSDHGPDYRYSVVSPATTPTPYGST